MLNFKFVRSNLEYLLAGALAFVSHLIMTANIGRQSKAYSIFSDLAFGLSVVSNLATNLSIGYYTWKVSKLIWD